MKFQFQGTSLFGVAVNLLEFELKWCYYVHFQINNLGKGMNLLTILAIDQIISLRFFYRDGFGIK